MSAISSPTLTQWRQGAVVSSKSIERLEEYTGMPIDDFMEKYDAQQSVVDDTLEVREMLRNRPEAKVLFSAAKNAPASAFYEAAALLLRYQEESEKK